MSNPLPYRVFCKSTSAYPVFEVIAGFNVERAAVSYAGECALSNPHFAYRVKHGKTIIKEFGEENFINHD